VFHRSGRQVRADQLQYPLVLHPLRHSAQQQIVVDPIEELLQIKIDQPPVACGNEVLGSAHCLVRRAPRPESVTRFSEARFKDRLQHLQQRLLNEAIEHAGYAKLTLATPSGLVDLNPLDRLRLILPRQQPLSNHRPMRLQIARELLDAHAVHPRTTLVALDLCQRALQILALAHPLH
jgi:hypothetical protein